METSWSDGEAAGPAPSPTPPAPPWGFKCYKGWSWMEMIMGWKQSPGQSDRQGMRKEKGKEVEQDHPGRELSLHHPLQMVSMKCPREQKWWTFKTQIPQFIKFTTLLNLWSRTIEFIAHSTLQATFQLFMHHNRWWIQMVMPNRWRCKSLFSMLAWESLIPLQSSRHIWLLPA